MIPAESGVFIPLRTNPEVAADWAKGQDLIVDRQVRESDKAMVLPGICLVIDGTPYCFVVNLGMHDTTIHPNVKLGTARVGGGEVQMSDPWTPCTPAEEGEGVHGVEEQGSAAPPVARQFLEEKLKLQQNPLMAEDPGLRDRVLDLFEENFAAVSTGDFDYGHATAVPYPAEGRGRGTRPAESPAAEPGTGGEHENPAQGVVQREGDRTNPEPVGVPHGGGQEEG